MARAIETNALGALRVMAIRRSIPQEQGIGVAHSATVIIERHVQALVRAIFDAPSLT